MTTKREIRRIRHKRIRTKIFGTVQTPRLCVFRSTKYIYVQLIDDEKGKTIAVVSDKEIKSKLNGINKAREVGKLIAEKAAEKKIKKVVFDRGGYQYHGRVKSIAEGAREGGLKF